MPSAKHALELLDQESFDLVVSDVVMPEMTGVEFLYELRERRPELPVVLMTGGSKEPERDDEGRRAGSMRPALQAVLPRRADSGVETALETS